MVDVDKFYSVVALRLRPWVADPYVVADSLMPTLIAAFEQIWEEGYDSGALAWSPEPLPGNPYGPHDYPDWPRRTSPQR